ncbi:GIY-YIG nuclease family protein, partial [Aduncisulcus paluster]
VNTELILTEAKIEKTIEEAEEEKANILKDAKKELLLTEDRIGRLKETDIEITTRLKLSRNIIEDITDKCSRLASDIELITDDDLLSSQSYQEDRKEIKARLKKLAINAIDGVKGSNADVNIGKFIGISAKADIAGALLLTTVEMLCSKVNANNGHNALEKLFETIIATESLIKCIDSRAFINDEFRKLLEERLIIEINYKKAKQIAQEEQREIREQEREERKAREEAEKIEQETKNEERIKNEAIAEIESQMLEKSDAERAIFEEKLNKLKSELEEVHQRYERARSRAQDTKQGNVYIISNIGSFGKNVFKIGMTRRMEPLDRVHELGNASVPFRFDVHALLESDDAPQLESTLHSIFDHKRVNKINRRKEYFNI